MIGKDIGRIDRTPLLLTCESKVTNIAPLTGSYLGGTVVTITGTNFSTNKLDNPVKVGDYWCDVLTTMATKITCRVRATGLKAGKTGPVSTFLRTSEEAKKADGLKNTWTFADPAQTVTGLTAAFDAATNTQKLTLAGTGFGTDKTKVTLLIDGKTQTADSLTATEGKFTLVDLDSEKTNVVTIYFDTGLPKGYDTVTKVAVTPNLVSLSPATGSAGGTLVTVTGTGFGKKTLGLTLIDKDDKDVCAKVTIKAYGSFECLTKPGEILESNALKIKTADGKYECANTDKTKCKFKQLTASSPTVTGFTVKSATVLEVAGTSFPTSGYTGSVVFKGVESTSAVIDSATKVTATFAKGVPVSKDPAAPIVKFAPSSRRMLSGSANFLQAVAGSVKLTSAPKVTASTTGLECSF